MNSAGKKTTRNKKQEYDPIAEVIKVYTNNGWHASPAPKGCINDIIALRDKKLHFIQIITEKNTNDVKFNALPKNTFIQNAFSNGAVAVYAYVVEQRRSQPSEVNTDATEIKNVKVTFEDANTCRRIIIGSRQKPSNVIEESTHKKQ